MTDFSEQLKQARLAAGLTQRQAAELMGVSFSTFCNWERGRNAPPVDPILTQRQVLERITAKP